MFFAYDFRTHKKYRERDSEYGIIINAQKNIK